MSHERIKIGTIAIALSLLSGGLLTTTAQAQGQGQGQQKGIQLRSQNSAKKGAQSPKQKLMQIRTQLQAVDKKLGKAQEAAMEKEEIQNVRKAYINEQKKQMVKIAPDKEEQINRRFQLLKELVASQGSEKDEKLAAKARQSKAKEFQQLNRSLRKIEKEANSKEKVKQKQKTYRKSLIKAMKAENENVESLLAKRKKLVAQYRQLRIKLQSLLKQRQKGGQKPNRGPQK